LANGRLVRLDMPDCKGGPYCFHAIYRADTPPGPAASYLIARFARQAYPRDRRGGKPVRKPLGRKGGKDQRLGRP
jgi:hypothetical protein